MRQGLASKDQSETHSSEPVEGSFIRSGSGTPLPADHSAAAEVMNTPTEGRSPRVIPTERISGVEGVRDQGDDRVNQRVSPDDLGNDRSALMRSLLKPKPIPGVDNFGIPAEPKGEINPAVQAKMEQFHHVKLTRGIHFNQSLMKNKNFRNPHIYTSLVEFVQLNETGSNFEQTEFFDFGGYGPESYATGIAEAQRQASERLAQQQAMARSHLQFVPGSTVQSGVPIVTANGASGGEIQGSIASKVQPPASLSSSGAPVSSGTQRGRKSKWDVSQPVDDPASKRSRH
ncbi:hypothetical protein BGZ70_009334 [Mortierella alpina]|uniref:HCNGP-domain-containing protein n=1 Tax=Mortierella alpina TaxID=64518 RepID=A0A9P6JD60_MORAP|nr:hypothetical protein BGZ70_009334 [Mortierella alpina]